MEIGKIEEVPFFDFSDKVHCTDFFEVMVFSKISGELILDTKKFTMHDNQFLFISPFQKRKWFVNESDIRGFFLIFENDFLSDFFEDKFFAYRLQYFFNPYHTSTLKLTSDNFALINNFFGEMQQEIHHTKEDSEHLLRSILYYILTKLNREFCAYHNIETDIQYNQTIVEFKMKLEENFHKFHRVSDYAEMLNVSRVTLNKVIKLHYNLSATNLIKQRIISEVKSELLYSNKSISEIAYELNFKELHHLTRLFKQYTDLTPKQFRENYQNGL